MIVLLIFLILCIVVIRLRRRVTDGVCVKVITEAYKIKNSIQYNVKFRPVIKYTWKGVEYTAKTKRSYNKVIVNKGDTVTVLVDETDKKSVRIISFI